MTSTTPSASIELDCALRLGWTIAELRGRYRQLPLLGASTKAQEWQRTEEALPLSTERSEREQARQTEAIVSGLVKVVGINTDTNRLSYARKDAASDTSGELRILCKALSDAQTDADRSRAWRQFTVFLYAWDAAIQDELLSRSLTCEGAYELGRAIAESYWALEPTVTDRNDMRSWSFLLGTARRDTVTLLLRRLSSYLDPLALAAIQESFSAWGQVASDSGWRTQMDALPRLQTQALLWRDILVGGISPLSLVTPKQKTEGVRVAPILEAFRLQLAALFLAVLALTVGIVLFSGPADKRWLAAGLAFLGFFGITGASLAGLAKSYVHELAAQIRLARDIQLTQAAATLTPKQAHLGGKGSVGSDSATQT